MSLAWHPENPTQLATACDDNRYPYINIWDLRKEKVPLLVLTGGHAGGITDMSWSSCDTKLLLACSKDNKTICWNSTTVCIFITKAQFALG